MARVVLILAPITTYNFVDVDELLVVDSNSQPADVWCNHSVKVQVVCDGSSCQKEYEAFIVVEVLHFDVRETP